MNKESSMFRDFIVEYYRNNMLRSLNFFLWSVYGRFERKV